MWEPDNSPAPLEKDEFLPRANPKQKPEGEHTNSLIKGIQKAGGFAYKIPDPVGSFKTNPRPFDVMACYDRRSIAIECKWLKEPKAFGMSQLRPCQQNGLMRHHEAGGLSLVVLFTKYNGRIQLLSWDWKTFNNHKGSYKKTELVEGITNGQATQKTSGIFPVDWLNRHCRQ